MISAEDFEAQAQRLAATDGRFQWVAVPSLARRSISGYLCTSAAVPQKRHVVQASDGAETEIAPPIADDDDGAAVYSPQQPQIYYEFHATYSPAYGVPEMLFTATFAGGQPLSRDEIIAEMPEDQRQSVAEGADTILTYKDHPLLQRPFFGVHPCRTRDVLDLLRTDAPARPLPHLYSWLSVVGQLLPVPQPVYPIDSN